MQLLDLIKKNKILFSVILIIIVILGAILYLNFYTHQQSSTKQTNTSINNSSNLSDIQQKVNKLRAANPNGGLVVTIVKSLNTLQDNTVSESDKYQAIKSAVKAVEIDYSQTNDPMLYSLVNDFGIYAKNNFPKYYLKTDFSYYCQDPSCANSPQPAQINSLVNEIKSSDLPDYIQNSTIKDLTNAGYLSKDQSLIKFTTYLEISQIVRNYSQFSNNGSNIKIADDIYNFAINEFPNEYNQLKKAQLNAPGSGLTK